MKMLRQSKYAFRIKYATAYCIKAIFIFSFLFICSCSAFSKEVLPGTSLREDEGVLITKIRTNIKESRILIHEKEETWPIAKIKPNAPEDLIVIRIKNGISFFSKIFRGDSFIWGPQNYFRIEPGSATYVGDLVIEWAAEKEGVVARIIVVDREEETIAEVKNKYPWVLAKFPYRKSIAGTESSK